MGPSSEAVQGLPAQSAGMPFSAQSLYCYGFRISSVQTPPEQVILHPGADPRWPCGPLPPAHLRLGVQWKRGGALLQATARDMGCPQEVLGGNGLTATGGEQSGSAYPLSFPSLRLLTDASPRLPQPCAPRSDEGDEPQGGERRFRVKFRPCDRVLGLHLLLWEMGAGSGWGPSSGRLLQGLCPSRCCRCPTAAWCAAAGSSR